MARNENPGGGPTAGRGEAVGAINAHYGREASALFYTHVSARHAPYRTVAIPPSGDQICPRVLRLWQASDAIRHMSQRLGALPDGSRLIDYLPALADGPDHRLRRRAALASTLVAGLELAREEVLTLQQDTVWAAIRVVRRHDGPDAAPATGPDS